MAYFNFVFYIYSMLYFDYTIYSAALIGLLAVIMLLFNLRSNKAIVYLSIFLILHAAYGITHTLLAFGNPNNKTTLFFTTLLLNNAAPLWWLRGPFLYFYVRSIINDKPLLKKADLIHFLPFAINFLAIIPYLFTSWEYKTNISRNSIGNVQFILNCNYNLFYPHMINNYLRPVQLLVYIVYSYHLVFRFHPFIKTVQDKKMLRQYRIVSYWLSGFLLLLFINTLFINYITFEYFRAPFTSHLAPPILKIYTLSNSMYVALPILILVFPTITYGMPKRPENPVTPGFNPIPVSAEVDTKNESISMRPPRFDEDYFIRLSDEIIFFLEKNQPFLISDFSLHDLSTGMDVPQHHLRYCLSHVMNKRFADLKNMMRIQYAITLLGTSVSDKISIDGIGRQSGFKSPSNFYASFKDTTGYTPSEWLKKNKDPNCIV